VRLLIGGAGISGAAILTYYAGHTLDLVAPLALVSFCFGTLAFYLVLLYFFGAFADAYSEPSEPPAPNQDEQAGRTDTNNNGGAPVSDNGGRRALRLFAIDSSPKAAAGALAALALGASAYAYFVEELTRGESVDFSVECRSEGLFGNVSLDISSAAHARACRLVVWPTLLRSGPGTPAPGSELETFKPQEFAGRSFSCSVPLAHSLRELLLGESPELVAHIEQNKLLVDSIEAQLHYQLVGRSRERNLKRNPVACASPSK